MPFVKLKTETRNSKHLLSLSDHHQSITDRDHAEIDARVIPDLFVEIPDEYGIAVMVMGIGYPSSPEDIIDGYQTPGSQER